MQIVRYQDKRGAFFRILYDDARIATDNPADAERAIVYQGEADGRVWVRPYREFVERFRAVIRDA